MTTELLNYFQGITKDCIAYEINSNGVKLTYKDNTSKTIIVLPESSKAVIWMTLDFELKAMEIEGLLWEQIYDKSLFNTALIKMIEQHNAENGINWDTILHYLNEYCKR